MYMNQDDVIQDDVNQDACLFHSSNHGIQFTKANFLLKFSLFLQLFSRSKCTKDYLVKSHYAFSKIIFLINVTY